MHRLVRLLLLALLLGPVIGPVLAPAEVPCEDTEDCCVPDGDCNATCVACACCLSRPTTTVDEIGAEPIDLPQIHTCMAACSVPLSPPPTEIQHVPKLIVS